MTGAPSAGYGRVPPDPYDASLVETETNWTQYYLSNSREPSVTEFATSTPTLDASSPSQTGASINTFSGYSVGPNHIYVSLYYSSPDEFRVAAYDRDTLSQAWEVASFYGSTDIVYNPNANTVLAVSNFNQPYGNLLNPSDGSTITSISPGNDFGTMTHPLVYTDYYIFGRNNSTGSALYKVNAADGTVSNSYQLNNSAIAYAVIPASGGVAYVPDGGGAMQAVNLDSMAQEWGATYTTEPFPRNANIAVVDGTIYTDFQPHDNRVSAIDASDGSIVWQRDTSTAEYPFPPNQTTAPIVTASGVHYIASEILNQLRQAEFWTLDPSNGDFVTRLTTTDGFDLQVRSGSGTVGFLHDTTNNLIVTTPGEGGNFYGVDPSTPSVSWSGTISNMTEQAEREVAAVTESGGGSMYLPLSINGTFELRRYV